MYRVVATLLTLIFAHAAWADWVKYDESPIALSYYDPTTIRKGGNAVRVWVFTDLRAPVDGQGSRRALLEFNCKEGRNRILQQNSFSGPMMSGEIDSKNSFVRAGEWKDISSGSPRATLRKVVCDSIAKPLPSARRIQMEVLPNNGMQINEPQAEGA